MPSLPDNPPPAMIQAARDFHKVEGVNIGTAGFVWLFFLHVHGLISGRLSSLWAVCWCVAPPCWAFCSLCRRCRHCPTSRPPPPAVPLGAPPLDVDTSSCRQRRGLSTPPFSPGCGPRCHVALLRAGGQGLFFCKHLLGGEGSSVLHLGPFLILIYITKSLSETGDPIYISEQRLSCLFSPSFSLLTSLFCNLRLSSLYLLVCKRFCPTDGTKDCFPQISVIVCQMAWQVSLPGIFLFVRTQVSVRNTYHCVRQCKCT